jgi:hypothetical protein
MNAIRNERGVALALSIFALVIIGALVAGAFFMGMQEQRVGLNTLRFQEAFSAAEEGANRQLTPWNAEVNNLLAAGDSTTISGTVTGAGGWYRGSIVRLNDQLFYVRSEGFSFDSTARQHVGLLVRLRPFDFDIAAALETQGDLKIGGSSYIDGHDQAPTGWTCPALEPPLPGIMINDSTNITEVGCPGLTCVDGSVKVEQDTTMTVGSMTTFGEMSFDDLKQYATLIIAGGTRKIEPSSSGGICTTSDQNNWGDPLNPSNDCGGHFPVVWVNGDLNVNGVQGQGVLIVDGNLNVQGGFDFFGPVIVRGALDTQGTGGHFNGGVIAANVNLEQNDVLGDAVITFSSCAIMKALQASAPGRLLKERSWANLY